MTKLNNNQIEKKCALCGFDKGVELHHIVKHNDFGSDSNNNLIYLCPNHHWVADFGDDEDKVMLLRKIKEITGKEGDIDYSKKKYIDKLVRAMIENNLGHFTDEEYTKKFIVEDSYNYNFWKKLFLTRELNLKKEVEYYISMAEIIYLVNKLNKMITYIKDE